MEAARGRSAGNRTGYNTWRKLASNKVLWKLPGVGLQVARLVTTPGGSWDGDQVLWKLPGIEVKVAGLVTTHGGSWDGDQFLWMLPGVGMQVTGLVTLQFQALVAMRFID